MIKKFRFQIKALLRTEKCSTSQGAIILCIFLISPTFWFIVNFQQTNRTQEQNHTQLFTVTISFMYTTVTFLFRLLLRGEELYTQMEFFVQSIVADRYIHRRELRLLSLESLSSVENG